MKDFYYILGVEPSCSFSEIQAAYTKLSGKFNPDSNNGDQYFQNRFREINEAYDILGNPYNRQQYDRELKAFYNGQEQTTVTLNRRWSGTGIGMTIVLILITVIFADYILQYFKTAEHKNAKEVYAADSITDTVPKKHLRKHTLKNRIAHNPAISGQNIVNIPPKPGQEKWTRVDNSSAPTVKHAAVKKAARSSADSIKKPVTGQYNNGVLYTTYVNPNATGVVNLRSQDTYSSPIFATIPANSKVSVLERGDTYYKISFYRYKGYVPKWALQIK